LTARQETKVVVTHAGQRIGVTLTREKFNELTADLLERTTTFTLSTINEAKARGFTHFDQILLVGGSTRMPQVAERLTTELRLPLKVFDPDEAVAKGAAVYGRKLVLDEKIQIKIAEITGTTADKVEIAEVSEQVVAKAQEAVARDNGLRLASVKKYSEMSVTNVASHSFGIIAIDPKTKKEIIANMVLVNDALPLLKTQNFFTLEANQETVEFNVIENGIASLHVLDPSVGEVIGNANLSLPPGLPENAPIEVTFELQRDGRLHMTGREPTGNGVVKLEIQTTHSLSEEELKEAKSRSNKLVIS
jgi:molecular chaperone DnaK